MVKSPSQEVLFNLASLACSSADILQDVVVLWEVHYILGQMI